jgi:hypothetical protein
MKMFDFYFRIDKRSLALLRILLALVLILDWFFRFEQIPCFYAESGISPLSSEIPRGPGIWHFSLLESVRSVPLVQMVFMVGLFAYVCFLVGYQTRLATALTWLFYVSVVNRIIIIRYGGDIVVITMLLWAMFLPMGAAWSVDRWLSGRTKPESNMTAPSLAALLIVAQVAIIYLATACAKCGMDWWDGSALYYAWNLDTFAGFGARYMLDHIPMEVIRWMTRGAWVIEFILFFLIMCPRFQPRLRRMAIALSTGLMLGIFLTLNVGIFPVLMVAINGVLLLPQDWETLGKLALRLGWKRMAGWISPETTPNALPAPEPFTPTVRNYLKEALLAYLTVIHAINCYNINATERFGTKPIQMPLWTQAAISIPQTYQDWLLFASRPYHEDGWYVFDGVTNEGLNVDPWTGKAVTYDKPRNLPFILGSSWMKVYERMCLPDWRVNVRQWVLYVLREYNKKQPPAKRIASLRLVYIEEPTLPPERAGEPVEYKQRILYQVQAHPREHVRPGSAFGAPLQQ